MFGGHLDFAVRELNLDFSLRNNKTMFEEMIHVFFIDSSMPYFIWCVILVPCFCVHQKHYISV